MAHRAVGHRLELVDEGAYRCLAVVEAVEQDRHGSPLPVPFRS
jgi:hypothetical protein